MNRHWTFGSLLVLLTVGALTALVRSDDAETAPGTSPVSYYEEIRPIFQAHCQGCHQPAKPSGEYVMTDVAQLLAGGESGDPAVVAGDPGTSYLIDLITPVDGAADMPKGKAPLSETEINLIRRWVQEGAEDDTPANVVQRYDADHPPVYTRPPVVTALDYSPDGTLLAISGFHEVVLYRADWTGLVGRLIGLSERIESVEFSPDGKRLAVTGGLPARMGEIQIWNVESQELELSIPLTFDTVYGASWSPDGSLIAVGCADNAVRAFNSESGEQVFFNGAHDDWALDTVFSVDGEHIVSVGRDMATKLYLVDTERFVDNVTSITPDALTGGLAAVARHPDRDEVLVGGSDGVPRIYRMERVTKRVIGDDANLMRRFPGMRGRIFDVDYGPNGNRLVAGSSLNGRGQVFVYSTEHDPAMPDDIAAIVQKVATTQSAEEKQRLEEYVTADAQIVAETEIASSGVYAVAFSPDGDMIAAAGADGMIRLIDAASGTVTREFLPVEISGDASRQEINLAAGQDLTREDPVGVEALPSGTQVTAIELEPAEIVLDGQFGYVQVLATGVLNTGDRVDVTRIATLSVGGEAATVSHGGRVRAAGNGDATLTVTIGDQSVTVPVHVIGIDEGRRMDFVQDVAPVISRLGCNAGTCHGAQAGKNGFKLSLRGYDPILDVRAFTDDMASRRVNVASPDDSLMLLKSTGAVPHVGGQVTLPGHPYYETIRQWIAEGRELDTSTAGVTSIAIQPENPVVQALGSKQQMRIVATYADGTTRDVTGEAHLTSGNTEVADLSRHGIVTTIRRGEAPILARFEGSYAATTVTSMGDRSEFVWQQPEAWNHVDELVSAKWERMKILPSDLCNDAEFIRRVYIDLTGLPPSADDVRAFVADERETQAKRDELIDRLIGGEEYVTYWTNKWADLLQVNRKFLGPEGSRLYRDWIHEAVAANTPYDEFCYQILGADGSNREHPAASYYKILREPDLMMENTTHLFLGVRFNCNKCHDHPFERWTQDQYYETAAFFAQVGLRRDPDNPDGNIGGTAVEGAKPMWEVVFDREDGEMTHVRTGEVTAPAVPYDSDINMPGDATRREQLARWITSPDNDYFAKSYVNRVWGYLMGVGLIEPLDDIRAGNPASNPELLDWLTGAFIESGFDVQELMRTIVRSRTYQLSLATNEWNEDDHINFSHAVPKRLPAEVLYDAIYTVTGSRMQIPGVPEGTRAAAIPDAGVELPDNFLANLGRPVRESACECERSSSLQLGPVMALMNGATVSQAISQEGNAIAQLVASQPDDALMINELFLRILNRPAEEREIAATIESMQQLQSGHESLTAALATYEEELQPILVMREQRRQEAIDAARSAMEAYAEEIRPREEQAEMEREQRIAAAQQALVEYEATLGEKLTAWEAGVSDGNTGWVVLDPGDLATTTGATLEEQDDLSIFATGPNNKKGNYTVVAETDLTGITGVKLELLADSRLPANGPGRAPNGNLVLTEFTVEAWPQGDPDARAKVELQNAMADFSQGNYDVATAIDGQQPGANNGWALAGQLGQTHIATFEAKAAFGHEGGTILHFTLDQKLNGNNHTIGRFRLSVTTATPPLQFGLPENILEIVQTPVEDRSDEQKVALLEYYKQMNAEYQAKQKALADAQQPRPEDPQLVLLRNTLGEAEKPLPPDPQLVRLQRAIGLSEQQLENVRLTTAQDLAWALINSPAFLFNR